MASGWNKWVWLECIGVVNGCCCKEVCRFLIILLIPTPLVLAAAFLLLCSFLKCFFILVCYFCAI